MKKYLCFLVMLLLILGSAVVAQAEWYYPELNPNGGFLDLGMTFSSVTTISACIQGYTSNYPTAVTLVFKEVCINCGEITVDPAGTPPYNYSWWGWWFGDSSFLLDGKVEYEVLHPESMSVSRIMLGLAGTPNVVAPPDPVVPEPSSILALCVGMIGIYGRTQRKKQ